jgi:hypothetical protein
MSEEGYTTIFHPGEEGVTVHDKGTLTITMKKPPILHGIKNNGDKLIMNQREKKHTMCIAYHR